MKYKFLTHNLRFFRSKKFLFCYIICCLLFVLNFVPLLNNLSAYVDIGGGSLNQVENWSDHTEMPRQENGVYLISKPEHFAWFFLKGAIAVSKPIEQTKAKLLNCIDLSAYSWDSASFTQRDKITFDGNRMAVKGLNGALINSLNSSIEVNNLTIYATIAVTLLTTTINLDTYKVGTIANSCDNDVTLSNVTLNGSMVVSLTKTKIVGGFVGVCKNFTSTMCFNFMNINVSSKSSSQPSDKVGGFVGETTASCKPTLCGNYGEIKSFARYIGGIVGYAKGLNLQNARWFNNGNITNKLVNKNTVAYIGGIAGYVSSFDGTKIISFAYNRGNIKNTSTASVEFESGTGDTKAYFTGGLVGSISSGKVKVSYCYQAGEVLGNEVFCYPTGKDTIAINTNQHYSQLYGGNGNSAGYDMYTIRIDSFEKDTMSYWDITDWSFVGDATKVEKYDTCKYVRPQQNIKPIISGKDLEYVAKFSIYKNGSKVENGSLSFKSSEFANVGVDDKYTKSVSTSTKFWDNVYEEPSVYAYMKSISSCPNDFAYNYSEFNGISAVIQTSYGPYTSSTHKVTFVLRMYVSTARGDLPPKNYDWMYEKIFSVNVKAVTSSYIMQFLESENAGYYPESMMKGNFGSNSYYGHTESINDDYPVFKEMYWELS